MLVRGPYVIARWGYPVYYPVYPTYSPVAPYGPAAVIAAALAGCFNARARLVRLRLFRRKSHQLLRAVPLARGTATKPKMLRKQSPVPPDPSITSKR